MKRGAAKPVAFAGVTVALAVTVMCLGGLIPLATYICPIVCMLILQTVLHVCGTKVAWAWYGAAAMLSVLLGPDKEAAAVFVFLGYYPIVKLWLDGRRLSLLWKLLLFHTAVLVMYALLIRVFGMDAIADDFRALGVVMTLVTLALGNAVFFLTDFILGRFPLRRRRK